MIQKSKKCAKNAKQEIEISRKSVLPNVGILLTIGQNTMEYMTSGKNQDA